MSGALAPGRQITLAGECSLTLRVTESPMTSVFTPRKRLARQAAVSLRKWCCRQDCLDGVTANNSVRSMSPPGGSLLYTFWSICFFSCSLPFHPLTDIYVSLTELSYPFERQNNSNRNPCLPWLMQTELQRGMRVCRSGCRY